MGYKFRICFQLPKDTSFTGDEESVRFLTSSGESMWIMAIDKDGKLGSSNRFAIGGGTYYSVEEAKMAGDAARIALLYYATTNRVGIDFGKYESVSSLAKAGKEMFSAQLGVPVLNDRLGFTVYEADQDPRFIRLHSDFSFGKSTPAFVETLKNAYRRYTLVSSRAEIAFELFTISYFESTPSARFLSLYMSFEVLFEPSSRSAEAQEHVSALIESTKNAEFPEDLDKGRGDKEALLDALRWLKKESIAQTGKKMADKLLLGNQYNSLSPAQFFDLCG